MTTIEPQSPTPRKPRTPRVDPVTFQPPKTDPVTFNSIEYQLGLHSAEIAALKVGQAEQSTRLDRIDGQLTTMQKELVAQGELLRDTTELIHEKLDLVSTKVDTVTTRLDEDISQRQPLRTFVVNLYEQHAQERVEAQERHRKFSRLYNVLIPIALALLASSFLSKVTDFSPHLQSAAQWIILGVTAVYLLVAYWIPQDNDPESKGPKP